MLALKNILWKGRNKYVSRYEHCILHHTKWDKFSNICTCCLVIFELLQNNPDIIAAGSQAS